ncbi:Gfo/Idh/MocA family protein [Paenibacillus sp. V4I7]|uniref:Gfo/Idh/MocA family protein n=1 Tax=Paenibacillus sp. V4I7 TaxID=3042307 RepID=UPI00277D471D|nr:Gfo/Idh/MocA family oxidoreductase [Paenibacillus sp. V4I7]MDQ0901245.1 putative dehydrogenase [Paenibacillus sp. V4I7]
MNTFRIGLIGLGGMAQAHIRGLTAEGCFEFNAVSDVEAEVLSKVGDQLSIAVEKRYADFMHLIEDPDVDAVVAVTPNHVHADIVRACLQARKPFMAEKPFTRVFEEAVPLLKLYEQQPMPAMIGFSYRYTPAFRYARELAREGKLGGYAASRSSICRAGVRHSTIPLMYGGSIRILLVQARWVILAPI